MSDDDDNITIFGTLLPQFAEDEIPTKKPKTIADQIVVDENGKRRFHGAFTGGFSAGFWNTVGSQEGWTPKTFKSSRVEKAGAVIQAPSDFMDEEDTGEFGIAPHRIQTTAEFTDDRSTMKRARISLQSDGPISGDPVKNLFIEPVKGKIAVNLLRRMGWKDEAAFRSCLTGNSEKTASASKVYHCDMGPIVQPTGNDDYDSDEDMDVSRRILSSGIVVFKSNRFGLGYVGLTKYHIAEPQQHINLFAQLEVADRMSKKVPIKGQAFGVGAFEEDDDDIYARDTMSNYDFSMAKEPKDKRRPASLTTKRSSDFPGCVKKKTVDRATKKMFYIDLPRDFTSVNWMIRKTRFGPTMQSAEPVPWKRNINPEERGRILLGDSKAKTMTTTIEIKSEPTCDSVDKADSDRAPSDGVERKIGSKSIIDRLGIDRFVSEKDIQATPAIAATAVQKIEEKQPIVPCAVDIKRTRSHWQPCKLLCQKMNVSEPVTGYKPTTNKSFLFFDNVALATKNRQRSQETSFVAAVVSDDKELNDVIAKQKSLERVPTIKKIAHRPPVVEPKLSEPGPSEPNKTVQHGRSSNIFKQRPAKKTALELRILEEQDKHPVEKKDLFNSIFNSSDDDSDDEPVTAKMVVDDLTIPEKLSTPKSGMTLNIFDNNPKPIILSPDTPKPSIVQNVLQTTGDNDDETKPPAKILFKSTKKIVPVQPECCEENFVYGPMIPATVTVGAPNNDIGAVANTTKMVSDVHVVDSDSNDSWIEKATDNNTKERAHKHKKSKKHKKHKHKSKKSKK